VRAYAARAAIAAGAVAVLLLAACSDDDDGGDASPTPPAPNVTPQAPAIIDGQSFISTAAGYAVEFPEGWSPDDNFLYTPDTVTDVFFAPVEGEGAQGNVQIRCDFDDGALAAQEFIDARIAVAEEFAQGDVTQEAATVANEQAVRLTYRQQANPEVVLQKVDIVMFASGCGWTITLAQGEEQDYAAEFEQMLSTFRFTG
jgi:hypothetical protein